MSNTLEQIQQGLVNAATSGGGSLQLDNSIIATPSYEAALTACNLPNGIAVKVSATQPATDIYISNGSLYVKGTATLYSATMPDFQLVLTGETDTSRTTAVTGTLSSLDISNLNSLQLITAAPSLPSISFSNIIFSCSSDEDDVTTASMSMTLQTSTNTWDLLPDLGINLVGVGLGFTRTSNAATTLNVTGNITIPNAGKQINLTVTIPSSSWAVPVWGVSLSAASGGTIIDLGDISTLLAGTNVFSQLPPGLSGVGNFGLIALQVKFVQQSTTSFSVQQITTNIGCNNWPVGSDPQNPLFTITSAGFIIAIQNPFGKRSITTTIYGNFQLNATDTLSITMTIPFGGSDWVLNAAGSFNLSSIAAFNSLPGSSNGSGFQSGDMNMPAEVSGASLQINYFTISFNPSSLQLSYITFYVTLNATWWIIENNLGFANPTLQVYIPGPALTSPPPLSVAAAGQILLPQSVILDVSASWIKDTSWSFLAALAPGSQVNVISLMQQFLGTDINPAEALGFTELLVTDFSVQAQSDTKNNIFSYSISATTVANWSCSFGLLPDIDATATVQISNDGKGNTSGSIAVDLEVFGIEFTVSYIFSSNNAYQLQLEWKGFTFTYDSKTNTIVSTAGDWTLGGILTAFVNAIDPSQDFTLPDPWSMLNSVSLKGLTLTIDMTNKNVTIKWPVNINLFFLKVTELDIAIENSTQVNVQLVGTYLDNQPIPKWDAASQSPPAVPGSGNDKFKLTYLGIGQHISLTGLSESTTVASALTNYENFLFPPDQGSTTVPVKATPANPSPGTVVFDASNSWMIAADFTVAQFYQVQFVFNDPNLYGLRIAIGQKASFLGNLDFEILYKKITDTIGMYQVDLQLPDQFRHLEFGEVSITLPNVGVQIYTNGNFYIDFGFPASITDFSRSFSIQVFPFVGYGGFYFGMLSGATSSQVPTTQYGQFNPVIVAGLGLSIGVGKTIDEGILSAGLSLTVVGIFEGVLGFYTCYADHTQTATYYKFTATVGITGHIYGQINFAIISAQLDIIAYIYATIVVESYKPIPISFQAGVSVKLTVKINLGLFKISISLSFSATISASFTIGSDTSSQALWNNPCTQSKPRLEMFEEAAQVYTLAWQPLQYDSGLSAVPALNLSFIPHLTVAAGSANAYAPQYVAMLYIDTPAPTDSADNSSMGSLARGVLAWALNAIVNAGTTGTTKYSALITQTVTLDQLNALMCVFNGQTNNQSPFDYNNTTTPGNDVKGFLQTYFANNGTTTINIVPVDPDTDNEINAAVFTPFPDLQLNATYNNSSVVQVDFSTQSMSGTGTYLSDITTIIQGLNVNYQSNTANPQQPDDLCSSVDNSGTPVETNLSLPTFLFTDFISLVAKQMLQNALDYVNGKKQTAIAIGDLLTAVCTVGNSIQLGGMASRFLLHGLRLPAPPVAATGAVQPLYVLTGQQFAIPATLKTTDVFAVALQKAAATTWIAFSGSATSTSLSVPVGSVEIQRIIDTSTATITPTLEAGYPAAATNYHDGQQAFTLGNPALWQYPGQYYSGVANSPYLLKLPSNLQTEFTNYTGNTPVFTVQYIDRTAANPQPANVTNFTWATSVNITLQKIAPDDTVAQSPLQANMYNLIGTDDTGVYFLENLVTYLNSPAGSSFGGQVQLLYQPDPNANSNGGYVSTLNNTKTPPDQVALAIIQANLSTETNPEQMMAFALDAVEDNATAPNTLNSFSNFVTLLWECSIVRSGGFYLYYNNVAGGNAGLPSTLFDANGNASVQILITYNSFVPMPFLNSMVIGDNLDYNNVSIYAQSASFLLRTPMMVQGNIGYTLQRQNPGPYTPPTDPTQPPTKAQDEIYLENQFNLIGLTLPSNPNYLNLLPTGPVDGNNTNGTTKSVEDTDDAIWNYTSILPYNQFVTGASPNWGFYDPYAGVGTTPSLLLNWQDMFGNVLPFSGTTGTLNVPFMYTDQIVSVSQWPSTTVFYWFTGDGTQSPVFNLGFKFNTDKYSTGDKTAQNNAAADLVTWARLWYQLNHASDMTMSYTVSVNATSTTPDGVSQSIDLSALQAFVKPIVDYLYAVASNPANVPLPTATTYTLTQTIDPTTVTSYDYIFKLATVITMTRTKNVDTNFTNVPGVSLAQTVVQPCMQQGTTCGTTQSTPPPSSILYFTNNFETAFNNPKSTVVYKVATATNLSTASSDPITTPPIWIVRFDTAGTQGIGVTYQQDVNKETIAYYFAPVPLATSLQSFQSVVVPYTTGQAFDPYGTGATTNFTGIDLDNWGLQFLNAVDKFLGPDYAVPAFLLDNGQSLQKVLDAKEAIAEAITGTVDYIITVPSDVTDYSNVNNAQQKWYQQLLMELSAAYDYTAAVQIPVTISSIWNQPNNDPPVANACPRLYGKMIGTLASGETSGVSTEQNASFSAAKLPTGNGQSSLTYMFQVENGPSQSVSFSEVDFAISHVEWQYESVQGIDGYLASSWLLIVSPQSLPTAYTNTGAVEIPIPLKAYPSLPNVTGQGANYPSVAPPTSNDPVETARSWDYTFSYQSPTAAQDTTIMQVQLNVPSTVSKVFAVPTGQRSIVLDQALAQFMSIYPQMSSDFDAYLLKVISATDPNAVNAQNAVNALISMMDVIGTAWSKWNQQHPFVSSVGLKKGRKKLVEAPPPPPPPVPGFMQLNYVVEETSAEELPTNPLLINVTPNDAATTAAGIIPVINIAGFTFTATTVGTTVSYSYVNTESQQPLLYQDRMNFPVRNPAIETLDVFEKQNAWAGLQISRNLDLLLVPGSTTEWQTTNPMFVYQTPLVMFYTIFQPLFTGTPINIATIPSPGGGTPPAQRSLQDQMTAFVGALTEGVFSVSGLTKLTIKLECLYEYQIANTGLQISIPVLLLPPYSLDLTTSNGGGFDTLLSTALTTWFSGHNPITTQAGWIFNLQVFSSFGSNLPMLSNQFTLSLTSIS
ncbi:MAG: hypothetical protein J0I41_02470 [Filimonas sp.]|nr:hypothetical protein [Filimonas sp.]